MIFFLLKKKERRYIEHSIFIVKITLASAILSRAMYFFLGELKDIPLVDLEVLRMPRGKGNSQKYNSVLYVLSVSLGELEELP